MNHTLSLRVIVWPCLATCLIASGCGSPTVIVKGRLLKGGVPLQLDSREHVLLDFVSVQDDSPVDVFSAQVQADGTFIVKGKLKKGIPRGNYRIAVSLQRGNSTKDRLDDAFNWRNTPFVRDVDGSDIVIDLDKPKK